MWLIGIPVILWAIAHWGFYYFVKSKLDQAILQVAPHAAIHYQDLNTSLSGKIDVQGMEIVPAGQEQDIFIRAVHVQGPDAISYLFQNLSSLGKTIHPPDTLKVAVKGIELDISGERAAQLDRFGERAGYRKTDGKQLDICRAGSGPSVGQLQEMGFEKLQGEMRFSYQYLPLLQKLYSDFSLDIEGMQHLAMSLALNNVPALDAQKMLGVLLNNLKITYETPPEFGQKVTEYCARKRGMTPEDFKLLMVDDLIHEIERNGIVPGSGLKHALKEYATNWGSLLLELSPPNPIGMFALMQLPREQIAEKLGLQLAVNGRLVTDLSFRVLDGVSLVRRNSGAGKKQKPPPPRVEYMWEYRKVPVGRLSNYLDHKVILKERDGKTHKGILVEAKDGRISIQQRISGGKFTAHLQSSKISSARVRVKVPTPASAAQQAVSQQADTDDAKAAAEQGQQAGG